MVRVQVASFNCSVLLLGACVKILVFIELLMPIVIAVDRRHGWPVPTFLIGCDLDFSLLSMYAGCGGQAEVVHGACPGLLWLFGRAEGMGCRWCLGNGSIFQLCSGCSFDFPGLNDVLLQSILRSISLHQPGTSELGGDYSLRVGQFIGGQCSFSGENHYNVKLQTSEGKKTSRDWLQSSSGSLCTGVNVFSSDHSSERTKGLMRDRGRMDPRTE